MDFDMRDRPAVMGDLTGTFAEAATVPDAELEDLIEETVDRGFH